MASKPKWGLVALTLLPFVRFVGMSVFNLDSKRIMLVRKDNIFSIPYGESATNIDKACADLEGLGNKAFAHYRIPNVQTRPNSPLWVVFQIAAILP